MNNYQNKAVKSWTVKDTEEYFKNILDTTTEEKLRVVTSKDLNDQEDLDLQSLIAQWYFKEDLKRNDNFVEDLLALVKTHTECNDFLLQLYIPIGPSQMCFGLKFEAISRAGIIQIGLGSFQECMLKGINNYLTNNDEAKSMLIIKGFDTNKVISYQAGDNTMQVYEKEIFHFIVENEMLYGVNEESAARVQEYDFTTQEHLGKEVGTKYFDTHAIVAEFEVDKLMQELGIYLMNH